MTPHELEYLPRVGMFVSGATSPAFSAPAGPYATAASWWAVSGTHAGFPNA